MQKEIPKHIQELINRYLTDDLTEDEHVQLNAWFFRRENSAMDLDENHTVPENHEMIKDRLQTRILGSLASEITTKTPNHSANRWMQIAATLLLISGVVLWWALDFESPTNQELPQQPIKSAYLVLEDQTQIDLSKLTQGPNSSLEFKNIKILENNKSLQFLSSIDADQENSSKKSLQQLVVPRGHQYDFYLPDGTKVWLNADSKLSFPRSFDPKERVVHLEGEAYFEVKSDEQHPFIVITKQQQIRVTGTSFNVSSFSDESIEKTSLFEGKVEIKNLQSGQQIDLQPGETGTIDGNRIDLSQFNRSSDAIRAWKSNVFVFENETQATIIKKLARWYNVEYDLKHLSQADNLYSGKIRKEASLDEIIKMLEMVMPIRLELIDNKLVVENSN